MKMVEKIAVCMIGFCIFASYLVLSISGSLKIVCFAHSSETFLVFFFSVTGVFAMACEFANHLDKKSLYITFFRI